MKKLLLATTALALSAGLAHAQGVTINGNGRMGLVYTRTAAGASDTVMENRLRLQFNVAIEADHGLTFGAFVRTQSGSNRIAGVPTAYAGALAASRVWVESNGLRLTFGNQDGAIQTRLVGAQTVGYTGGTFWGSSAGMFQIPQGQTSNGLPGPAGPNQRVAVSYEASGYYVHVSHDRSAGAVSAATEIAVGGTFGQFSVMLGHATRTGTYAVDTDVTTLAGAYNGGSWGVSAIVARAGNGVVVAPGFTAGGTNWMLGGNVALGGGTLNGYVGRVIDANPATNDNTYGLGYSYGLGGGARVAAAIERTNDATRAEVGVAFNF